MPLNPVRPIGWRLRDLGGGGHGDCFLRAVAEGLASQESPPGGADRTARYHAGAVWRANSVGHVRRHMEDYRKRLFRTEANFEKWLSKAAEAQTWAEGKLVQACAEKRGAPIVMWAWSRERSFWEKFIVADRFRHVYATCAKHRRPICAVLREKHYVVLQPPEGAEIPNAWLRECVVVIDLSDESSLHCPSLNPKP